MRYKGYVIYTTLARVLGDAVVLYASFLISFWVRFHSGVFSAPLGIPPLSEYAEPFLLASLILLLVFKSFGLYNDKKLQRFSSEFSLIVKSMALGVIILMSLTFLHREYSYSRLLVGIFLLFGVFCLTCSRYVTAVFEQWLCRLRGEQKQILILGIGETAKRLLGNLRKNPRWESEVVGFLGRHEDNVKEFEGLPVFGDISRLKDVLEKKKPDEVILAITGMSHDKMVELIAECEKNMVSFKLVPDMFEIITSKVDIHDVDGIPLLGLKEIPMEYAWNRFMKRAVDIAGSVVGIIIALPICILVALIIKLTSRGTIFYRQARCGEDGRNFVLYKFRTMRSDAETTTGPVWAQEDDPRCTWIGRWLRKFYLDELPQLFNVLKGDMSMVGPRPERPNFVQQFKDDIPKYMSRHLVKSGMTGWAQVNGLRGNTPLKQRVQYDMYYMENWSVWFDLKIIFMTIFSKKRFADSGS